MKETNERLEDYYGLQTNLSNLYNKKNNRHNNLFRLITKPSNIKLALVRLNDSYKENKLILNSLNKIPFKELKKRVISCLHSNQNSKKVYEPIRLLAEQCLINILEPITESVFKQNNFGSRRDILPQHCIGTFNNSMWACIHQGYEYTVASLHISKNLIDVESSMKILEKYFGIYDKAVLKAIRNIVKSYTENHEKDASRLYMLLYNCQLHLLDEYVESLTYKNSLYGKLVKQGRREYKSRPYYKFREKYENCFMARYVRYNEDILIGCSYKEDMKVLLKYIADFMKNLSLTINLDQVPITVMSKYGSNSIDFLNYKIKTTNGHIRISIRNFLKVKKEIRKTLRFLLYRINTGKYFYFYKLKNYLKDIFIKYDICTNLEPLITYCNRIFYRMGYSKLNVLGKLPNHDIYYCQIGNIDSKSNLDLYKIRKNTTRSYKKYVKIPYWKP